MIMEQNEGYINVKETIKSLEVKLGLCDDTSRAIDKQGTKIKQDIEDHFAKYIKALNARKAVLLQECTAKIAAHKKTIEDTRMKVKESIEGCKKALETGAQLYRTDLRTATCVWKMVKTMPSPQVATAVLSLDLPSTLLRLIQTFGSITVEPCCSPPVARRERTNRFGRADSVTTFAGFTKGLEDGNGTEASFSYLRGICYNPHDDCMYACDSFNHSIRRITMKGDVTTFAYDEKLLMHPHGITMNFKDNTFYVTDTGNSTIVQISSTGFVSSFAGSGSKGYRDGVGASARFNYPSDATVDQQTGNIYVSDYGNQVIRKITPHGEVSTLAGSGEKGFADGMGRRAKFHHPWGITMDHNDRSLIVCDEFNNKLRRVSLRGEVTTLCELQRPAFVAITSNNTILASSQQNKIHRIMKNGSGIYEAECIVGPGQTTQNEVGLCQPNGIAVHENSHSCFVAEYGKHTIRQISFV